MERNVLCFVSSLSVDKSALIAFEMLKKLADHIKRFGRITTKAKVADRKTESLKLALMGCHPL
jgi:hypothetical protein